ncbi:hypothetical protein BC828DRAFT_375412 [Blastocladiella britannica]|nr:hypothetical protein BC828DRAFT_375412 [Blastocladiella britannica]
MTLLIPDLILDTILVLAAAALAHGVPERSSAIRIVNQNALRSLISVTASSRVPNTTRLALLLFKHCTLPAAASKGRADILALRRTYFGPLVKIADAGVDNLDPFLAASRDSGNLQVLEMLCRDNGDIVGSREILQYMGAASSSGFVQVLEFWHKVSPLQPCTDKERGVGIAIYCAALSGTIPALEWWAAHPLIDRLSSTAFPRRVATKRTPPSAAALSWWYATCARGIAAKSPYTWPHVAMADFVQAADSQLFRSLMHPDRCGEGIDPVILSSLSFAGRPDDLTWWTETRGTALPPMAKIRPDFACATTLPVLKWWWARFPDPKLYYPVTLTAVALDRTELLDWAHSHGAIQLTEMRLAWHVTAAAIKGHLSVLVWFQEHSMLNVDLSKLLNSVSKLGHVHILDWMVRTLDLSRAWPTARVIETACNQGHCLVLKWWINVAASNQVLVSTSVLLDYSADALDSASTVEVVDWWLHGGHGLPLKYTHLAMNNASCSLRCTALLDLWLASGLPLKYTHQALEEACSAVDIRVLEWWRTSGLRVQLPRAVYDRRRYQVQQLNGIPGTETNPLLQSDVSVEQPVLQWWEQHVFDVGEGECDWIETLPEPVRVPLVPPDSALARIGWAFGF